jgi:transmembrane sensor
MQKDAQKLLEKYKAGSCSEKEKAIVESWYLKLQTDGQNPSPVVIEKTKDEVWDALTVNKEKVALQTRRFMPLRKIAGWAAILLMIASIGLYFNRPSIEKKVAANKQANDVAPGGNKAFLTLADGRKISLTDAANGELVKQEGLSINKTADGQLVYNVAIATHEEAAGAKSFNTIETPKGGKYQINLPDGTRVWLNAASSLRYPIQFKGKTRTVELVGEGYFEVAKIKDNGDKRIPFIVKSRGQEVEVLGTHFNINSYLDEADVKTTLIEGAVKVTNDGQQASEIRNGVILKPGQQSQLTENSLNVKDVDLEAVLAWKDGDFLFEGEDLKSIMRKVSRWYDVDVTYKGEFDNLKFGGLISRSKNISSVLGIMESTGRIHFIIEGKRVIVLHNK